MPLNLLLFLVSLRLPQKIRSSAGPCAECRRSLRSLAKALSTIQRLDSALKPCRSWRLITRAFQPNVFERGFQSAGLPFARFARSYAPGQRPFMAKMDWKPAQNRRNWRCFCPCAPAYNPRRPSRSVASPACWRRVRLEGAVSPPSQRRSPADERVVSFFLAFRQAPRGYRWFFSFFIKERPAI